VNWQLESSVLWHSTLKIADVEMVVMTESTSESPEINHLTEEDIRHLLPPTEEEEQLEQMTGVEVDGSENVSDNELNTIP
jgi:hypothetical protein